MACSKALSLGLPQVPRLDGAAVASSLILPTTADSLAGRCRPNFFFVITLKPRVE